MARLGLRVIRKPNISGSVTDANGNALNKIAIDKEQEQNFIVEANTVTTSERPPLTGECFETGSKQVAAPILHSEPILESKLSQNQTEVEQKTNNKVATSHVNESDTDRLQETHVNFQGSNRVQSGFKQGSQDGSNRVQSGFKQGSNKDKFNSDELETGFKVGSQQGSHVGSKWVQSGFKVGSNINFSSLVKNPRKIVFFIYESCRSNGEKISNGMSIEHLAVSCEMPVESARTAIKRLIKQGFISRRNSKTGNGGWTQYSLSDFVYQELLNLELGFKQGSNEVQTGFKVGSQQGSQQGSTVPCSSSISFISNSNTTTTTEPPEFLKVAARLENEIIFDPNLWHGLNFSKLVKYVFQAGQWVHSVTELQEMLDGVSAVIESKKSTQWPIDNALRFLHACLTKWHVDVPSGYKSRREREAETKKASFEKERDQFLQDYKLLGHQEIQTKIEAIYAQKHSDRNKPGWGMNLKLLQREFLNELYVTTRGYGDDILALLGGQGMKRQLGIDETAQSLGLDQFVAPRR